MDLREHLCIHASTMSVLKLGKATKSCDVLESIHFESFKFQVTGELPFSYKCFDRILGEEGLLSLSSDKLPMNKIQCYF